MVPNGINEEEFRTYIHTPEINNLPVQGEL